MNRDKQKIQSEVQEVFARLRAHPMEAPPHLQTRVLAHWRERRERGLVFWKRLALGSCGASFALALLLVGTWLARRPYVAYVGEPFVVRISIQTLPSASIAKARIELPPGVYFNLDRYPELAQHGELTLRWKALKEMPELPLVLRADRTGIRQIRVSFLDEENRVLFVKTLDVDLKRS